MYQEQPQYILKPLFINFIYIKSTADIKCVVCNASKLSNLIAQKSDCQQLETIVLFEETVDEALRTSAETEGIKVYSYTEIEVSNMRPTNH